MGRMPGRTQMPEIEQISRKIEQWRKTRLRRTRMPDELWDAAVALAREHGVYATARDLRISYDGLKSRLDGTAKRRGGPSSLSLVEIGPETPLRVTVLVVER